MNSLPADELRNLLRAYGARRDDVTVLNDAAEPEQQLRYLDLIRRPTVELWPRAVVEVDGQPILYVVESLHKAAPPEAQLTRLRRILAFRASADHVALIEPGQITVHSVQPSRNPEKPKVIDIDAPEAPALVTSLAFPPADKAPKSFASTEVHKLVLGLLTGTTDALIKAKIAPLDALSLVGRALFVRFLVDRDVLSDEEVRSISGVGTEHCFEDPVSAAKVSAWLDETFNGDFLPLPFGGSAAWFRGLSKNVFSKLTNVLERNDWTGQRHIAWGKGWSDLLFDHITVGLISQVYELHAHRYDTAHALATSVHYTPRLIAEYMVDEVFSALGEKASRARVLDPAVGGGIFLVSAFRRLVAERWKVDGKPPNTSILRQILYRQLRGFDISEHALRLCSLSLYLTAIELDPKPRPPRSLKFNEPLLDNVLHHVAAKEAFLGSLSSITVGAAHRNAYEVVIGNPPWKSWKPTDSITKEAVESQVAEVNATVREVVRARLGNDAATRYKMVDNVPDLPFFWRAIEWAKPGGHIALALHARLLFKQSKVGKLARDDLFSAVHITGILNGTALRDTKFWPSLKDTPSGFKPAKIRAPFCLVFARNALPSCWSSFYFVSPEMEKCLNDGGRLRIDATDARPVEVSELRERPALLKTRFRGTTLDAGVMARIEELGLSSLGDYWKSHGYGKGQGFQVVDGGTPVGELAKKPCLTPADSSMMPYLIDTTRLKLLGDKPLYRTGDPRIYQAPLVIVDDTPPVERSATGGGARLALKDVVYSRSFFGFSCAGVPDAELWAHYLFLLLNSRLAVYFALMQSSRFGIERDALLLEDVARFPLIPLDKLDPPLLESILPLSRRLIHNPESSFDEVERWAAAAYGLSRADVEVIRDTLDVSPPFARTRARAQARPNAADVSNFKARLLSVMRPFFARRGCSVSMHVLRNEIEESWVVLQIDVYPDVSRPSVRRPPSVLAEILEHADTLAVSQVTFVDGPGVLLLAIVAQYRYFTPSRARLLGLEVVHQHAKTLLVEAG